MKTQRVVHEPIIAISHNEKEEEALLESLNLLPINEIIKKGNTVAIIPNLVKNMSPESATITGPQTLKKLIQKIKTLEPRKIYLTMGSGGDPTPQVVKEQGFDKIIKEESVEFIDLNYGPYKDLTLDIAKPSATPINKIIDEVDVLISFTQVKMHREATVSLGIKNMALSVPPAEIHGFPKVQKGIHEDLHNFIAAMAKKIPIDLTILSTSPAMIGTGPSDGKPVYANLIIAGTDPIATDVIGSRLLGFLPPAVSYLYKLIAENIGEGDVNKMNLKGIPLDQAEQIFSQSAYSYDIALDKGEIKPIHA